MRTGAGLTSWPPVIHGMRIRPAEAGYWTVSRLPHQETSCCAWAATRRTSRSVRSAYTRCDGYPVVEREELKFLSERFYNNPRPFYGFEQQGAVWSRVISALANVLGRMAHLMNLLRD